MRHGRFSPRNQASIFERPRGARGIIPLILGAMAVGKGIAGAVQANQTKKRREGFIDANYQLAKKKLNTAQADVRQGTSESLMARGLTQGGLSPIHAAMAPGASHSLGEQVQSDNEKQFALENTDLENQRNQANSENEAGRNSAYLGAAVGTAQGIMGAMSAGGELSSSAANVGNGSIADASTPGGISPIRAAMTGVDDPSHWFGGVVGGGADPLSAPGSSWNRNRIAQPGMTNAEFNVG
jgi:hypothetical protein